MLLTHKYNSAILQNTHFSNPLDLAIDQIKPLLYYSNIICDTA